MEPFGPQIPPPITPLPETTAPALPPVVTEPETFEPTPPDPMPQMMGPWHVRVGINVPDAEGREVRYEPGDTAPQLPATVVTEWLAAGIIERVEEEEA